MGFWNLILKNEDVQKAIDKAVTFSIEGVEETCRGRWFRGPASILRGKLKLADVSDYVDQDIRTIALSEAVETCHAFYENVGVRIGKYAFLCPSELFALSTARKLIENKMNILAISQAIPDEKERKLALVSLAYGVINELCSQNKIFDKYDYFNDKEYVLLRGSKTTSAPAKIGKFEDYFLCGRKYGTGFDSQSALETLNGFLANTLEVNEAQNAGAKWHELVKRASALENTVRCPKIDDPEAALISIKI